MHGLGMRKIWHNESIDELYYRY